MTKAGRRILDAIHEALAYAQGGKVDGIIRHDFDVRDVGEREVVTHYENGQRDPVKRIRKKDR